MTHEKEAGRRNPDFQSAFDKRIPLRKDRIAMASTPEIRKVNKRNTYRYIYRKKECSKQELAYALGQSLPTVNQNLKDLMEEGMVHTAGQYESTGGRKAAVLQCTADARVSVGVEILHDHVVAVLLDLYGTILSSAKLEEKYANEETYFRKIGRFIADFVDQAGYSDDKLLGIVAAVQGIPDYEHRKMVYGRILNNWGLSSDMLGGYIGRPCLLMHDSESAAFAESFHRPDLRDSCYVFLNNYLGSASIIQGKLYRGNHGRGQLVEHMKLVRGGRKCYCGQYGCAESYCSAYGLKKMSGMPTEEFFYKLRRDDPEAATVWDEYLDHLALLLHNVLMVMDVDIIIGGVLRRYMCNADLVTLKEKIRTQSDFSISDRSIAFEYVTDYPAAQGAALYLIQRFMDEQ